MAQQVPGISDPLNISGSARGDQGFICRASGSEVKRVFARWQALCTSRTPCPGPRSMTSAQPLVEVLECLERSEALWKAVLAGMEKGKHQSMERQLAGMGKDIDAQVLHLETQLSQARQAQARIRAEIVKQLVHGRRAVAAAASAVAEAAEARTADSDMLSSAPIDVTQLADLAQLDPSPDIRSFIESAYKRVEEEFKTKLNRRTNDFQEEKEQLQKRLENISDATSNKSKRHEDLVARLKEKLLKKTGRSALPAPLFVPDAEKMGETQKLPPIQGGGGSPASRGGSKSSAKETSGEDPGNKRIVKRWGVHFVEQLSQNSYPTKPAKWHGRMEDLRRNVTPRHARSREEAMQQSLEMANTADFMERFGGILELPRVLPAFNMQSSTDSFLMTEESSLEFRSMELH
eukprot:TRINITY_DN95783_c0_g1_i1.p1 TRINITY_DN95783_c0_g1~~TRINITY_DN95783_c0_g1_i1.p1  ORF type:complete len:405 (+),score=74.92 TRINITY_DN95783_c0_g1_i1:67-1281(+)